MKRLTSAVAAVGVAGCTALLTVPGIADAQPAPCAPGFTLLPSSILCTPDPNATPQAQPAPAQPAPVTPAPAPRRTIIDRLLGRNRPAPATPAPAPAPASPAPAPAPAAPIAPSTATPAPAPSPYNPPPTTAPAQREAPAIVPLVILPAPGAVVPNPSERTVWLHTCVDLYVANNHLLQIDNQILDVPDLATVLFQCSTTPALIGPVVPFTPVPATPGQPPAAGNQVVFEHLPVTG